MISPSSLPAKVMGERLWGNSFNAADAKMKINVPPFSCLFCSDFDLYNRKERGYRLAKDQIKRQMRVPLLALYA